MMLERHDRALLRGHLDPTLSQALIETYGEALFGPTGLEQTVRGLLPRVRQQLASLPLEAFAQEAERLAQEALTQLPLASDQVTVILGTLLYLAPAATLSVNGVPTVVIGLERFVDGAEPPEPPYKFWYRLPELAEMIPHELAHVTRMRALNLPASPHRLSLLDMFLLEGTALSFTDELLGKQTLRTFMDDPVFARHQQHETEYLDRALQAKEQVGLGPFFAFFSRESPISGYYVGYALCQRYLDKYGRGAMAELLTLPSSEVLRRLG